MIIKEKMLKHNYNYIHDILLIAPFMCGLENVLRICEDELCKDRYVSQYS